MPIRSVLINVTDLDRSIDFYSRFLDLRLQERTDRAATLDAVTATLRLVLLPERDESTFVPDDLQAGFRHVGFKVADLAPRVAALKAAGVPFQLDPLHAEGDVDITFFLDPDGTVLELVEGALQYHEVYDRAAVEADWALGDPDRPRFDHVAETVRDLAATEAYFGGLGFVRMAGIHQPNDPRGYEIDFLRDGDASLEIFTFAGAEKTRRAPQTAAPGFAAVEFAGAAAPAGAAAVGTIGGLDVVADPDGLVHAVTA
ncbi:VOC family protein [uncultured Amnibacterium sp.]|uniref:VOC family protein n=1 Tax=uncultured Amnibacterium sp. TaxID=1631851 RepID=UPI0035C997BA